MFVLQFAIWYLLLFFRAYVSTFTFTMANLFVAGIIERQAPPRQITMVLERPNVFEEISDREFINTFRLSKNMARELINELAPYLPEARRKSALSAETRVSIINYFYSIGYLYKNITIYCIAQVLVALRFFAQGSYQQSVGNDINLNVCQKSVSNCLNSVVSAIVEHLAPIWIKFPNNNDLSKSRIK